MKAQKLMSLLIALLLSTGAFLSCSEKPGDEPDAQKPAAATPDDQPAAAEADEEPEVFKANIPDGTNLDGYPRLL